MKQNNMIFTALFIGMLIVSVSFADPIITGNWTITNPSGNGVLTDYPVLLTLTSLSEYGLSSCYNNSFYYINASGYTQIPYYVDSATGGCQIWMKAPYINISGQAKYNIGVVPNTNSTENMSNVFSWAGDFTLGAIPSTCAVWYSGSSAHANYSFSAAGMRLYGIGGDYGIRELWVQCAGSALSRNAVFESKTKIVNYGNQYKAITIGSTKPLANLTYIISNGNQLIKAETSNASLWYHQTVVSSVVNGTYGFSRPMYTDALFHKSSLYTYTDNTTLYVDDVLIDTMYANLYYSNMYMVSAIKTYNDYGYSTEMYISWMRERPLQENGEPYLTSGDINITVNSPDNNTAYNNTPIILNFTLVMPIPTAVCHYYIDGVMNYWPLIVDNNTPYDVSLPLALGSHNIDIACGFNTHSGQASLVNITNSTVPSPFDALSIIIPSTDSTTHYSNVTFQYVIDATNMTSASCSVLNINGSGVGFPAWDTETVSTNAGITRHYPMARGNQTLLVYCQNGTAWTVSSNRTFYVEPIVPMIAYPSNNTVLRANNFILTYAYASGDLLSANCNLIVDSAPLIGVFPTPSGGFHNLFINMSSGAHNISVFCSNSSWNGSSAIYHISMEPESINLISPENNTAVCGTHNALFSFSWSSYTHFNESFCGVSVDSPWDINTDPELDILTTVINNPERTVNSTTGSSLSIYANNLTNGFHNASVWCADAANGTIWSIHSPVIQFVVEPACITIDHLDTSALCDNADVTVNMKTESLIAPGAFCYISLDLSSFIGSAYLLNNTYYNLTISNVTSGTHTLSAYCDTNYNPTMRSFSGNYSFSSGNASCIVTNFNDALLSFVDTWEMLILLLSFVFIGIVTYIGWRLAGSMGALICMNALIIILAVIPSPPFIPLWIAIVSIASGIIGLVYTQKND